jgi:transcriptional regulator with XRE-family HTH domain
MGAAVAIAYDVTMARFGARLRELRERSGLSLAEAGSRAGIARTMWHDYESGRRGNPTLARMKAMAAALDVTLLELLESVNGDDP